MKFRPQVQLRFRDEGQYIRCKDLAADEQLSLNEWILRKVENGREGKRESRDVPDEVSGRGVPRRVGKSGERRDIKSVGHTPGKESSGKRDPVDGGGKKDRGKQGKDGGEGSEGVSRMEKYIAMKPSEALRAMRERKAARGGG